MVPGPGGHGGRAGVAGKGAARGKAAARRRSVEIRHAAGNTLQGTARRLVGRDGRQEPTRVRVLRAAQDAAHRPRFDDVAGIHDGDAVAQLRHDADIVGDQQDRQVDLAHQVGDQAQDLRLHRNVQRRGRLVGNQQVGPSGDGHGDEHTLAHAAAELVRVGVDALLRIGDAHLAQQLHGPRVGLAAAFPVGGQPLAPKGRGIQRALAAEDGVHHLLFDREDGVEPGHRVLKDNADMLGAQAAQFLFRLAHDSFAQEADVAAV